jgi:hypothetical protein
VDVESLAVQLARWAHEFRPGARDEALADRALLDTVAVALAGRRHPVTRLAAELPPGPRWAVAGHVLDFDDPAVDDAPQRRLRTGGPGHRW